MPQAFLWSPNRLVQETSWDETTPTENITSFILHQSSILVQDSLHEWDGLAKKSAEKGLEGTKSSALNIKCLTYRGFMLIEGNLIQSSKE